VEGGGAVGAGEPADGDEGAGTRVHLAAGHGKATLPCLACPNTKLPLPTRPLRAAIRSGTHGGVRPEPQPRARRRDHAGRAGGSREERRSAGQGSVAGLARLRGGPSPLPSSVGLLVGWLAGSARYASSFWLAAAPRRAGVVPLLRCRGRINQ